MTRWRFWVCRSTIMSSSALALAAGSGNWLSMSRLPTSKMGPRIKGFMSVLHQVLGDPLSPAPAEVGPGVEVVEVVEAVPGEPLVQSLGVRAADSLHGLGADDPILRDPEGLLQHADRGAWAGVDCGVEQVELDTLGHQVAAGFPPVVPLVDVLGSHQCHLLDILARVLPLRDAVLGLTPGVSQMVDIRPLVPDEHLERLVEVHSAPSTMRAMDS